mgnify:CR=1 FL=1
MGDIVLPSWRDTTLLPQYVIANPLSPAYCIVFQHQISGPVEIEGAIVSHIQCLKSAVETSIPSNIGDKVVRYLGIGTGRFQS